MLPVALKLPFSSKLATCVPLPAVPKVKDMVSVPAEVVALIVKVPPPAAFVNKGVVTDVEKDGFATVETETAAVGLPLPLTDILVPAATVAT